MNKHAARIDKWFKLGRCLGGIISEHPRQSEFKAPLQQTSPIVRMGKDKAESLNTVYTLGAKAQPEDFLEWMDKGLLD